jgi:hypothetical protein
LSDSTNLSTPPKGGNYGFEIIDRQTGAVIDEAYHMFTSKDDAYKYAYDNARAYLDGTGEFNYEDITKEDINDRFQIITHTNDLIKKLSGS